MSKKGYFDMPDAPLNRLKNQIEPHNNEFPGVYKCQFTGEFLSSDSQRLEVIVMGVTRYARPCYNFGGRVSAPSQEFLKKYKNEIFGWVIFEEADPTEVIWIGWNWLDGKQTGLSDYPDAATYRTRFFREIFNDKTKEYAVFFDDGKNTYYTKLTDKGWYAKVKEVLFDAADKLKFKSKRIVVEGTEKIYIGSDNADQAMVKGNTLNDNLKEFIRLTQQLISQASQIATNASSGVAAVNSSAAALLAQNAIQLQALNLQFTKLSEELINHLSRKITVE